MNMLLDVLKISSIYGKKLKHMLVKVLGKGMLFCFIVYISLIKISYGSAYPSIAEHFSWKTNTSCLDHREKICHFVFAFPWKYEIENNGMKDLINVFWIKFLKTWKISFCKKTGEQLSSCLSLSLFLFLSLCIFACVLCVLPSKLKRYSRGNSSCKEFSTAKIQDVP